MLSLSRFAMFSLPVLVLLSAVPVFANPKSRTFNAPADDLFRAAQKAGAGHRIVIPQDEGLKKPDRFRRGDKKLPVRDDASRRHVSGTEEVSTRIGSLNATLHVLHRLP